MWLTKKARKDGPATSINIQRDAQAGSQNGISVLLLKLHQSRTARNNDSAFFFLDSTV